MIRRLHPIAGGLSLATILVFWLSTVASELSGSSPIIVAVKQAIPWGFLLLVPAIAVAGASGFRLGKGWRGPLVAAKRRRMPIIALNGICVLVPCALALAYLSSEGRFDSLFYIVQAVELIAGAGNMLLMALSLRDGLRIRHRQA
ncbi:MAG: hypothetical protein P4L98_04360 [Ancalomicrobiaceae bacterium]|nr:hypothetical protein [Ancalomicrobiaceae bacterium]